MLGFSVSVSDESGDDLLEMAKKIGDDGDVRGQGASGASEEDKGRLDN